MISTEDFSSAGRTTCNIGCDLILILECCSSEKKKLEKKIEKKNHVKSNITYMLKGERKVERIHNV